MTLLLWNLLLALLWILVTGQFTPANFIVGFLIGFVALRIAKAPFEPQRYFRKAWKGLVLFLYFLKELVLANFRVARDVVSVRFKMKPAIVPIPLDARTDAEITLLANMITLTPGTLSIDVSEDRRVLVIHAMFAGDIETVRRDIKRGFEARILEVSR